MEEQCDEAQTIPSREVRDVTAMFTYHCPVGNQPERYEKIRNAAKDFALLILEVTPKSADQTTAIRKLRECVMTANAAIALEGKI